MVYLNHNYLCSNRGILKMLQIVCGAFICSLLCGSWYGGKACFEEGRQGFTTGLNFVCLIINVVVLVLNLLNLAVWKLEKIYSIIATVLFAVGTGLMVWYFVAIDWSFSSTHAYNLFIASMALVFVEFLLFMWEVKILQGEAAN